MYLDDAVKTTADFEGRIHWMYLDTTKHVTVGVGQMIPTAQAALLYRFRRSNAEYATRDEILAEYETVKRMIPGHVAKAYRRSSSLLLADEDIDQALRKTMSTCVVELASLFPDFHDYPEPAKVALIDMRFNLGLTGLRLDFPDLCRLVEAQRWDAASLECHRIGPSEERNAWTKEQFLLASSTAMEQTL